LFRKKVLNIFKASATAPAARTAPPPVAAPRPAAYAIAEKAVIVPAAYTAPGL